MGDEEEWRKLSVEDKIVNKLWKARVRLNLITNIKFIKLFFSSMVMKKPQNSSKLGMRMIPNGKTIKVWLRRWSLTPTQLPKKRVLSAASPSPRTARRPPKPPLRWWMASSSNVSPPPRPRPRSWPPSCA